MAAPGTSSDPRALLAEARGILRHCPDPGPVVAGWLADEQRAESVQARRDGLIEPLTDRELTILRLLPAPTPQRELASALFVTPNTLRTHLRAIYRKLGAESRDDAVIRARERGLIQRPQGRPRPRPRVRALCRPSRRSRERRP